MAMLRVAALVVPVFAFVASADTIINTSVSTGGGGGTCSVTARYNYASGGSVSSSGVPCGGSVLPMTPGATAAQLSVSAGPGRSDASNSFDLSTGTVRGGLYSVLPSGGGSISDTLRDGVVFNNTNAKSVLLGVSWNITGTLAPDPSQSDSFDLNFQGVLGGVVNYTFHYDTTNGNSVNNTQITGYNSSSFHQNAGGPGTSATAFYLLNPGLNPLTFQESIGMGGSYGSFDFGHTFQLGLIVPDGVTYTSDSGAFMTAAAPAPAPVPEPASLAVAGTALAILGVLRARRRRRAV